MFKKLLFIMFLGLLTGCATAKQTYAPDGGTAHSINCSGSALNWGMCFEKAGEICKERGYEVITGGSDQDATVVQTQQGGFGASKNNRSMLIKCK